MNEQTHIVSRFDAELNEIQDLTLEMAKLARKHISSATKALAGHDTKLAKKVAKKDRKVNELQAEIDAKAVALIAQRQPMASDLRMAVAPIKIATDLERIGDHAKTMARRARDVPDIRDIGSARASIKRMSKLVQTNLNNAMKAYRKGDVRKAAVVHMADAEVDMLFSALFRELLTYMMSNPANIEAATHLLFIARNLERCGDHISNICEQVHYIVTGETFEETDEEPAPSVLITYTSDE